MEGEQDQTCHGAAEATPQQVEGLALPSTVTHQEDQTGEKAESLEEGEIKDIPQKSSSWKRFQNHLWREVAEQRWGSQFQPTFSTTKDEEEDWESPEFSDITPQETPFKETQEEHKGQSSDTEEEEDHNMEGDRSSTPYSPTQEPIRFTEPPASPQGPEEETGRTPTP